MNNTAINTMANELSLEELEMVSGGGLLDYFTDVVNDINDFIRNKTGVDIGDELDKTRIALEHPEIAIDIIKNQFRG